MPDRPPPPSRRDSMSPAASHYGPPPDDRLRDAWLDEMWAPVREFHPHAEPAKKAKKKRRGRSPGFPIGATSISTGSPETAGQKGVAEAPECA